MKKAPSSFLLELFEGHTTPMCIVVGRDLIVRDINKAMLKILKKTRKNLIGKDVESALPGVLSKLKNWKPNNDKDTNIGAFTGPNGKRKGISARRIKLSSEKCFLISLHSKIPKTAEKESTPPSQDQYIINDFLKSLNEGFFVLDYSWKIMMASNSLATHTPYTPEELIGKNFWEVFPDLVSNPVYDLYHKVRETGKPGRVETEYRGINFEGIATPGQTGLFVFFHEITERKIFEHSLIEERDLFNQIINSLPGIFYVISDEGRFLRWNKNFETVSGYSGDEIGRMSPLDFFEMHEKALIQQRIEKVFHEGSANVEASFLTKAGNTLPHYFNGSAVLRDGRQFLVGMGIDISQRIEATRFRAESEERLRYIFQTEPNCVKILDGEGSLLQMNRSGLRMIEADQFEQVVGHPVVSLVDKPFQKQFNELTQRVIKGESGSLQFSITGLKGTKRWLETHAVPLRDDLTGTNLLLGVTRDITEQKGRAELIEAIREVQQEFITRKNSQQFFDFVANKICSLTESEFAFFGEVINEDGKKNLQTFSNVSDKADNIPVDFSKLSAVLNRALAIEKPFITSSFSRDFASTNWDESYNQLKTFLYLPIFSGCELSGVICLANKQSGYTANLIEQLSPLTGTLGNILEALRTDRYTKKITEDLQETSRRLDLTYQASGLGIWQVDFVKRTLTADKRIQEILGLPTAVVTMEEYWNLLHPADRTKKMADDRASMESYDGEYFSEYRMIRPSDGEVRYLRSQGLIFRDKYENPISGLSVVYDQTIEKLHEQKLLDSLREKEMLIKEIHHRVKNNLQLISSMLFLKMENAEGAQSRDFLTAMREKIKSVSLIHERLLQTENLDTIDIKEYLQKLLHDIHVTYHRQKLRLNIRTDIEEIFFSTDYAMYLGQLVNELVINATTHAFEGRGEGEILVSLNAEKDKYVLVVKDNGIGLPLTADLVKPKSYGMQLVQIFVRQLKGKLSISRTNGTTITIEFTL